jgi:hypothetical protein
MKSTTEESCTLIDEAGLDVGILRDKLKKFCRVQCTDPKDLCCVCTINAMIYHLRFFELTFECGEPRDI